MRQSVLMAHGLSRKVDDWEVPGSSPTQDSLLNYAQIYQLNRLRSKAASESTFDQKLWSMVEYVSGYQY